MSTLVAQTISNGSISTSTANVINGAKAWVNFNGQTSPGTIRTQYNVSSVTKNGTGNYTLNFTNAFADANYAFVGSARSNGPDSGLVISAGTRTTTTCQIFSGGGYRPGTTFGTAEDSDTCCVAVFR